MYSFCNDYSEGAIPMIMERLQEFNKKQNPGYGMDEICDKAREKIQEVLQCPTCDIHFLVGGTQANLTVIASALRPYEAVMAADSGHINVHETGAIEASGHKVVIVASADGKVSVEGIYEEVRRHCDEHMVKPKMVYISDATELGSVYRKAELQALRKTCDALGLYLFMDGARLGCALTASDNDVSFADLCKYIDVFSIGGTKNGALFGEAVVIVNEQLKKDFRYMIKQRGGMLAKGWLLGLQFLSLFEDDQYRKIAAHANAMAQKLQTAFVDCGYSLFAKSSTNQIFVILPNEVIKKLEKEYAFQFWEKVDATHTAMRFVTSWATPEAVIDEFITYLKQI